MHISVYGLTSSEKASLMNRLAENDEYYVPDDFEDDPPAHRITFEGARERMAALAGLIAFDHLHPDKELWQKIGFMLRMELRAGDPSDNFTIATSRPVEAEIVHGLRWSGNRVAEIGAVAFFEQVDKSDIESAFSSVEQSGFGESLDMLRGFVEIMESEGVFGDSHDTQAE